MIDAVLTHPHHPSLCGVSKFSHRLARELGIPCRHFNGYARHPLVSLKFSELYGEDEPRFMHRTEATSYDLFVHDAPMKDLHVRIVNGAETVYAANIVIARAIRTIRPDVIESWCPSTIEGNPTRGEINVLTFGMAHKIQTHRYEKLKQLLDATGKDYTVSVSTAVHEGSPWDETARVGKSLRDIFGSRTRVLGYLADDALARELGDATAVALFFDPALRANNTTFWAALDGCGNVITNHDHDSPITWAWDIDRLTAWPTVIVQAVNETHTWQKLLGTLQDESCEK